MLFLVGMCLASAIAQPMDPAVKPPMKPQIDSSQQIADRIVNSKKPVLIDFWAVWCGPCRYLNPIIKELEKEYKGRVDFIKINVDVHRQISAYFGVSAIPSVFIVKDKSVVNNLMGLRAKEDYQAALDQAIAMPTPKPPVSPESSTTPAQKQ
jgi:thioredoxin 1